MESEQAKKAMHGRITPNVVIACVYKKSKKQYARSMYRAGFGQGWVERRGVHKLILL